MSYPDIFLLLNNIITWKYKYNIKLVMLIHDYYSVCPVYFLIDYNNNFCGYNEFKQCSSCLKNNIKKYKHMLFYNNEDIIFWRSEWKQFLVKCDIIETFSNSSKNIIETIFGSLPNINTILHTVDYINPKKQSKDFLTIGFLGKISFYKGLNIIQEMSDIIEEEDLRIKLVHIGYPEHPINGKNYIFTGEYLHHEISGLSKKNNIDIFFISSIWPETFSYTTQEIIEMDIPLACFDIGAPAERIKLYKKGLIIPEISARCAIQTLYEWYKLNF
jgi:glycosyltransferase involved in cell wall biosynthesis